MKSFENLNGKELIWLQKKASENSYELQSGGEPVASLSWEKSLSSPATCAIEGKSWSLVREGFFRPHISIRAKGSDEVLGVMEFGWTGAGMLKLTGGATYKWEQRSFWSGMWAFCSDKGKEIVSFKLDRGLLKTASVLQLASEQDENVELGLLCSLGWYVLVLYSEDSVPAGF